ncbi:MAG: hypothetical protein Q9218_006261 [Villophora microphyllina]
MPRQRGRQKQVTHTPHPVREAIDKTLLPPCDGPQLAPFPDGHESLEFVRLLSDPDPQSEAMTHVFEVRIAAKPYALKIFKYYDRTKENNLIVGRERAIAPQDALDHLDWYFDPFYKECRAYGRLLKSSLDAKVAVHCHGYMMLPARLENKLLRDFGAGDWQRPREEYKRPTSERQALKAIVKDLVLEKTVWDKRMARKALGHLKKIRAEKIYVRDIKEDNYVGGLLVDFSVALTEPHFIFDIKPAHWVDIEKTRDLEAFDVMIEEELGIKDARRATSNPEYLAKLRSYTSSKRAYGR